ncbi:2-hydroxychromene-2-carboxylate isomerase [Devosia sp. CN2-171]|uniref:2-hydroxychromene-2-carboxylate isomerase n=1 Tax=Devosia sp. CN2-171 TaxID=3400909 RepID=UPI003BF882FC
MAALDFWFSIGSTYSYLSVMRLADVSAQTGIRFNWRPFNVRAIMREMDNIPFANKPVKAAYMWRDVARRAARYGLRPQLPAPYPISELERANRVALVGMSEGWGEAYVRAAYIRWFEHGEPAGSEPNLGAALRAAGQDPDSVLPRADGPDGIAQLDIATAKARALGIFGSPTFVADRELFWGDDRLEDAIDWLGGRLVVP